MDGLPPAYSEVDVNSVVNEQLPNGSNSETSSYRNPPPSKQEIPETGIFTKELAMDRLLFINTSEIYGTTQLIIKPDINQSTGTTIKLVADITPNISGLQDMCNLIVEENDRGEYEVKANTLLPPEAMMSIHCRFIFQFPANFSGNHPGIRAKLNSGNIRLSNLDKVHMNWIHLTTIDDEVYLDRIHADIVYVSNTTGAVNSDKCDIDRTLYVSTATGNISLNNSTIAQAYTYSRSGQLEFDNIKGKCLRADTTSNKIDCSQLNISGRVDLCTTDGEINAGNIQAGSIFMSTCNAKIEWSLCRIKHMCEAINRDGKIEGTIVFDDINTLGVIRLLTTNANIKSGIGTNAFRGTFEAKTTLDGIVEILESFKDAGNNVRLPLYVIVNETGYKRGILGELSDTKHQFSASTTNANIELS